MEAFKFFGEIAILVLLLLKVQLSVSDCGDHGHVNGCSIPYDLPYFYKDVFEPDCNKHDICYACGDMYGVTRKECDQQFWEDLKNRCDADSRVRNEKWCEMVTFDYYAAVRLGGSSHYESSSPSWCYDNWVSRCL